MRSFALFRSPCDIPQSHDQIRFRKTTTKTLAQVPSMRHGGGRHGGNTNHIGFALFDKINHLADQSRHRDGLHKASRRLQYLRQHHSGDFIRLVASGQAEDAQPRRVGRMNETGICASALRRFRGSLLVTSIPAGAHPALQPSPSGSGT